MESHCGSVRSIQRSARLGYATSMLVNCQDDQGCPCSRKESQLRVLSLYLYGGRYQERPPLLGKSIRHPRADPHQHENLRQALLFKSLKPFSYAYNRYRCAGSRSRCKSPRSQVRRDSRPNRYQPPNAETYRYQTEVLIPNLIPFAQECENERVGMIVQEHKALHMRIMLKLPFIA